MCCYRRHNLYFDTRCYQQYVRPEQAWILEKDQVGYSRLAGNTLHYHLRLEFTATAWSDI
jgi:hypothetical protein